MMGNRSLQLWLRILILVILFIDCFAISDKLSSKDSNVNNFDNRILSPTQQIDSHPDGDMIGDIISLRRSSRLRFLTSQVSDTTEATILLDFQNGVKHDPLSVLSDWNYAYISNHCNWTGVQCNNTTKKVSSLILSGHQLSGSISPSLGGLGFLVSLDLSNNSFWGTIPPSITNCSNLTLLDLHGNQLTGEIPTQLGLLKQLHDLHLGENNLEGLIPGSIGNCSSLATMDLSLNQLIGGIPQEIGFLFQLKSISFAGNSLTGPIPTSFGNLSSLGIMNLESNQLTGEIPSEIGLLSQLFLMALNSNNLTGSMPTSLGNCSSMVLIDLQQNQLAGEIPANIGQLYRLGYISLRKNQVTGPIPTSLSNCSSLVQLDFGSNNLMGGVPIDIGLLSKLTFLSLGGNSLRSSIPTSLGNCSSLTILDLNANQLTGEIPTGIGSLSRLNAMYLEGNNLGGPIPPFRLLSLATMDLTYNQLTGEIPQSFGNSTSLVSLALSSNNLQGPIPLSFGRLAKLQGLSLSSNQLNGIPTELFNCTQLSVLDLSNNIFIDGIPSQLGNLTNLNELYLQNNNFTGSISSIFGDQPTILDLNLAYNGFTDSIDGYNFGLLQNLHMSLNLSHNFFYGPLPQGIGLLKAVQYIDFSFNDFSGMISGAFQQCIGLKSLDLSFNNLDGEIPQMLLPSSQLIYFNVSYNNLTGSIPHQLNNFSDVSFIGNPNLCGPMLSNKCSSQGNSSHKVVHPYWLWIVLVVAMCYGTVGIVAGGVWLVFIAKKRAKKSYSSDSIAPTLLSSDHFTNELGKLSMSDLVVSTKGFSDENIIGMGPKSTCFLGALPSGLTIVVKRLELRLNENATQKLYQELQMAPNANHPNLLKVYGFYSFEDLKVLLSEYMPNGSLHKQLYNDAICSLTWPQRLNIALGVAEAMVYLHHSSFSPIIHRDLKPTNVLLDANMEPKVGDYAMSTIYEVENYGDSTFSRNFYGTIGYIPPEYGSTAVASTMGDVYNFGLLLMELFTHKQPIDEMFGEEISFRSWVMDAFPSGIYGVLDPTLSQELSQNEQDVGIHLIFRLAIACTRDAPKERPTMREATEMLHSTRRASLLYSKSPVG